MPAAALRVILTRPAPQAQPWAAALTEAGFEVALLPLIHIAHQPAPAPLPDLSAFDALFFVSRNALDGLLAWLGAPALLASPARLLCPGGGTAQALLDLGIPASRIVQPATGAPQDSEQLWLALQNSQPLQKNQSLLVLNGSDTNQSSASNKPNWLAEQARHLGVVVTELETYCRSTPDFTVAQAECAQASLQDGSIWLFSSSQSIANLTAAFPTLRWDSASCIATHPRIAHTARQAGFSTTECDGTLNALVHHLHQFQPSANIHANTGA